MFKRLIYKLLGRIGTNSSLSSEPSETGYENKQREKHNHKLDKQRHDEIERVMRQVEEGRKSNTGSTDNDWRK